MVGDLFELGCFSVHRPGDNAFWGWGGISFVVQGVMTIVQNRTANDGSTRPLHYPN